MPYGFRYILFLSHRKTVILIVSDLSTATKHSFHLKFWENMKQGKNPNVSRLSLPPVVRTIFKKSYLFSLRTNILPMS